MFGRIKYLDDSSRYGYIDTGQDDLGDLRFTYRQGEVYRIGQTVSYDVARDNRHQAYAIDVHVRAERNTSLYNTEDKEKWYSEGEELEEAFLDRFKGRLPRGIRKNPEKEYDPTVIDLVYADGRYADLKTQNTPFFTANRKNRTLDPQYTVTFNRKDYRRYKSLYPDCDIYFWVNWTQTEWGNLRVEPLEGVWVARFADMAKAIETGQVTLHPYKYRVNDEHNAKDSYLFDLRSQIFTRLI